ncbi:MAG: L,D-transpeptidase family protein [Myxococcota bacterium]
MWRWAVDVALACPASLAGLQGPGWLDPADPRLQGADLVVVFKGARQVGLYDHGALARAGEVLSCWRAAFAPGAPEGPKTTRGDHKTPEGWYRTSDRPTSQFYHALNVHYPSVADADVALAAGRITAADHARIAAAHQAGRMPPEDTRLGGLILLHGGGSSVDWTLGCVALDDADIDALRAALPADLRTDVLLVP